MNIDTNSMTDGLRKVFMAGVGAMATVGERGGEFVETFAERGESVVRQGKDLNRELTQKGADAMGGVGEDVLRATLAMLSSADRAKFVAAAQRIAGELDAQDAARAATQGGPVTVPVDAPAPQAADTSAADDCSCGCDAR